LSFISPPSLEASARAKTISFHRLGSVAEKVRGGNRKITTLALSLQHTRTRLVTMSKSKDKSKKDSSKKSKSRSEAPQENDAVQSPAADVEVPVEAEVAPKKEKKRKRDKNAEDDVAETPKKAKKSAEVPAPEDDATTDDKQKKKDKKAKKSKKSADAPAPEDDDTTDIKQAKKDKKSKKRKAADAELAEPAVEDEPLEQDFIKFDDTSADKSELPILTNGTISRTDSKNSKKKDKKDKKARKAEESKADDEPVPETNGDAEATPEEQPAEGAEDATPGKKEHFAVFVGNLPFTATKEEILQHFEKIHPKEVRIMTHKETGKPKGFAFVEFTRFDHMQTCLKKYHHSVFGEGKKGRKINVELRSVLHIP
jgi:nucleolar protein 6